MPYMRLPNNNVVAVDDNGYTTVNVQVSLSDLIDNDLEGLLDLLSEQATGCELMTDVSYSIAGHHGDTGDTLTMKVTGCINECLGVDAVDASELPMEEFEAEVTRISYGSRTFRLSARTAEEARDIADDDAGNHTYSEHASEYEIEVRPVLAHEMALSPA